MVRKTGELTHLLENIRAARRLLVEKHKLTSKIANALIGKSIFVRYLIDRKVKMRFDDKFRVWTNNEFCELLNNPKKAKQFFDYLESSEKGFNGDLFPISENEYKKLSKEDYQVIRRLLLGEDIDSNQLSLFQLYDFSIIPIEFISNVYELFIGEDNQKEEGAYYTPLFLVDYILKETVEKHLKKENGFDCKVLDPACGSGIFLVETLRKIIEKFISDTGIDIKSDKFKTALKNLAKNNIYGVDKDLSAVQVAVFSVYLTLLDYLEPPGIETFKFPLLLNTNFFQGDFFDEKSLFNSLIKQSRFDFILGNPPWFRGKSEIKPLYIEYIKKRKRTEKDLNGQIEIGNKEIAQAFLLRSSDFSNENTKTALIVTSKVLYNLQSASFRKYFLNHFIIEKIFELAPVRREVFEKSNRDATAPACILFFNYSNGATTDNNVIEHITLKPSRFFSLFKIFTINRTDFKRVQQKKLKDFDWLWKVLVYGSYLDFNFINRLKKDYASFKDLLSNKERVVEGTGIQFSNNPPYDSRHLKGMPFIDAYAITQFFINPDKISVFNKSKVHRRRDERLFKAPMLLIRKGINLDSLTAYCAISYKNAVFKDSVTCIKALNKADIGILKSIAAIFVSDLFSYYAINTFSSIGIEREQTYSDEKYSLPYLDINVNDIIDEIEEAFKKIFIEKQKLFEDEILLKNLNKRIQNGFSSINERIFDKLQINDEEVALIDYALNVNRVLISGDETKRRKLFSDLNIKDAFLEDYAKLFIDRFKSKLNTDENKFIAEIWCSKQIIGMLFKMIPIAEYTEDIIWVNRQNDNVEIVSFLIKISSNRITDKLFVQKDIRGFDKQNFYIFKPNERRLWHKAIGYIDVNEFADAVLKAGRNGK